MKNFTCCEKCWSAVDCDCTEEEIINFRVEQQKKETLIIKSMYKLEGYGWVIVLNPDENNLTRDKNKLLGSAVLYKNQMQTIIGVEGQALAGDEYIGDVGIILDKLNKQ